MRACSGLFLCRQTISSTRVTTSLGIRCAQFPINRSIWANRGRPSTSGMNSPQEASSNSLLTTKARQNNPPENVKRCKAWPFMASTRIFLKAPPEYRGFFHVNANFVDLALEIATMAKTAKARINDFFKCDSPHQGSAAYYRCDLP